MGIGKRDAGRGFSGPVSADAIYSAALDLFSRHSFSAIGMRDIGDQVGIRSGSLYSHIGSKEEILHRIVRDGINNYLVELRPIRDQDDPAADRLRQAIRRHVDVMSRTPNHTSVAFHQWQFLGGDAKRDVVQLRDDYESIFSKIVEDGVHEGAFRALLDQRAAVIAIIGMLTFSCEWYVREQHVSPDEFGRSLAAIVVDGLVR